MTKKLSRLLFAALALATALGCAVSSEPTAQSQPTAAHLTPLSNTLPPPAAATATPIPAPLIQAYFSGPQGEGQENGPVETALLDDLQSAGQSIDIAMYNLSLDRVVAALIAAHKRGVTVRMVTDSDDINDKPIRQLINAGISVKGDQREGLMHHKFLVIDEQTVWTGSLNLTSLGAYQDNNNFNRIQSDQLAENYTVEFEEMFLDERFGPDSQANTPHLQLQVGEISLENYFSPDDQVSRRLVQLIGSAQESIDFLAYSFTLDSLAEAVLARANDGVSVRGVFDSDQVRSNTGGEFANLQSAGLDVRRDGNPRLMHHKVWIIDHAVVVFGSYNFSRNADRTNDENILIVRDPSLAARYEAEFEKIYAQAAE